MTFSCVYILSSRRRVLYIGVTADLKRRLTEHRSGVDMGFSAQYQTFSLVHYEMFVNIADAIAREKALKGWRRARKIQLIEATNPEWKDLANELFF